MNHLTLIIGFQIAETGDILFPVFILTAVDDSHHPADGLFSPDGKPPDGIAIDEGLILFWIEILPFIYVDRMNPVSVTFMNLLGKIDERS